MSALREEAGETQATVAFEFFDKDTVLLEKPRLKIFNERKIYKYEESRTIEAIQAIFSNEKEIWARSNAIKSFNDLPYYSRGYFS